MNGFVGCIRQLVMSGIQILPRDLTSNLSVVRNSDNRPRTGSVINHGVLVDACEMFDRCTPNPCRHGGICYQVERSQGWAIGLLMNPFSRHGRDSIVTARVQATVVRYVISVIIRCRASILRSIVCSLTKLFLNESPWSISTGVARWHRFQSCAVSARNRNCWTWVKWVITMSWKDMFPMDINFLFLSTIKRSCIGFHWYNCSLWSIVPMCVNSTSNTRVSILAFWIIRMIHSAGGSAVPIKRWIIGVVVKLVRGNAPAD